MSATPILRIAVPLIVVAAAAAASLPFASQLFHGAWVKDAAHDAFELHRRLRRSCAKTPGELQRLELAQRLQFSSTIVRRHSTLPVSIQMAKR